MSEGFSENWPDAGWYLWKQLIDCETPYWSCGVCQVVELSPGRGWQVGDRYYNVLGNSGPVLAGNDSVMWKRIDMNEVFDIRDGRQFTCLLSSNK